jgi:hypothetical protein
MQGAKTSLLNLVVGINPEDIRRELPQVAISLTEEKRFPELKDSIDTATYLLIQLDYEYQISLDMDIYESTYPVHVRESVDSAILITVNANDMVTMVEDVTEKLKSDKANVRKSIANDGICKFLFVRLKR